MSRTLDSYQQQVPQLIMSTNEQEARTSLEDDEAAARKKSANNILYLLLINTYSAIFVFVFHLISLESLISIGLSVGLTIYTYNETKGDEAYQGATMTWVLLSFAVITPIGAALTMAFSRREMALQQIAILRSTFLELYASHAIWDWDLKPGNLLESGRTKVRSLGRMIHQTRSRDTGSSNVFFLVALVESQLAGALRCSMQRNSRHLQ